MPSTRRAAIVQIHDKIENRNYYSFIFNVHKKTMQQHMNHEYIMAHNEVDKIDSMSDQCIEKDLYISMMLHSLRLFTMTIVKEFSTSKIHPDDHESMRKWFVDKEHHRQWDMINAKNSKL